MKRLVPISVFVLVALLISLWPLAASAQSGVTSIYVVRAGDTAFSIASRHCMTVQELTNLNGAVISNPNLIFPNMQLRVVNRCGGSAGGGSPCTGWNCGGSGCTGWNCGNWGTGVFDRGPSQHAQGTVWGNTYLVARGDTAFSIAQRFGITVDALCQANGINPWFIWAGQRLTIPGLGSNPCLQPCPQPCPPNCPQQPTCPPNCLPVTVIPLTPTTTATPTSTPGAVQVRVQITRPQSNEQVPQTVPVTGTTQGMAAGTSITVQAMVIVQNNLTLILAEQSTTVQGNGTFQASLTVQSPAQTQGFIVAFPTQAGLPSASVPVWFLATGTGVPVYTNFNGSQCTLVLTAGAPFYATVGAAQPSGYFPGAVTTALAVVPTAALQGAKLNNQYWFQVGNVAGTTGPVWAPLSSVQPTSAVCTGW